MLGLKYRLAAILQLVRQLLLALCYWSSISGWVFSFHRGGW